MVRWVPRPCCSHEPTSLAGSSYLNKKGLNVLRRDPRRVFYPTVHCGKHIAHRHFWHRFDNPKPFDGIQCVMRAHKDPWDVGEGAFQQQVEFRGMLRLQTNHKEEVK